MSQICKHKPAHGACTHFILYLWAVATYLVVASDILWPVGHTIRGANDGLASPNGEWNLQHTAGEWIESFFMSQRTSLWEYRGLLSSGNAQKRKKPSKVESQPCVGSDNYQVHLRGRLRVND